VQLLFSDQAKTPAAGLSGSVVA